MTNQNPIPDDDFIEEYLREPLTPIKKEELAQMREEWEQARKDAYVGDVVYIQEKVKGEFPQVSGRTYFRHQVLGKEGEYYDYDGDTYTAEEMREKLIGNG